MPGCKVWDVVRVPFPYTNRPVRQHRPALAVALPVVSAGPRLVWVLMITSAANRPWPHDVPIADWAATGLPVASVVRVAKIATIEAQDAAPIGRLGSDEQLLVVQSLRRCLDLGALR